MNFENKKKIVFCLPSFITGGVERVAVTYLNALAEFKNYDISLLISDATGLPCFVADDPLRAVVNGTGVVLQNYEFWAKENS